VKEANYEMIIRHLEEYNQNELFYKEYSSVKDSPKDLAAFILAHKDDVENIWKINNPELVSHVMEEDEFLPLRHNVIITKHNRYTPMFFHEHKFFEIMYILAGSCKQYCSDNVIALKEGDLCLIAPFTKHGIEVYDDSIVMNILMRQSTFLDIFNNVIRDNSQLSAFFFGNFYKHNRDKYVIYHTAGDWQVTSSILEMYLEQLNGDEFSDHIICSMLELFFVHLSRLHKKNMEIPQKAGKTTIYDDEIINYVIQNYSNVSLESLAAHLYLSPSYCSRLVRSITKYSFTELINNIKMQHGEKMLINTHLSIASISEKLGYENTETFIRAFKRHYKTTPNQFRKGKLGS
jgi:AraC-like DNA-binding protein/mannose-6-phosphate isomerase-like protein (cupin superfamily)